MALKMTWISKDDNSPCWNKERKALNSEVECLRYLMINSEYVEYKKGSIKYRLIKEENLKNYDLGNYP